MESNEYITMNNSTLCKETVVHENIDKIGVTLNMDTDTKNDTNEPNKAIDQIETDKNDTNEPNRVIDQMETDKNYTNEPNRAIDQTETDKNDSNKQNRAIDQMATSKNDTNEPNRALDQMETDKNDTNELNRAIHQMETDKNDTNEPNRAINQTKTDKNNSNEPKRAIDQVETDKNDTNEPNTAIDQMEMCDVIEVVVTIPDVKIMNDNINQNVDTSIKDMVDHVDNIIFTNMNKTSENHSKTNTSNETSNNCDQPSNSNIPKTKKKMIELFTNVEGPSFYNITGNIVTDPVISKNLPKAFESLPVCGKPNSKDDLQKFLDEKLRAYVGPDIVDEEYEELAKYCSPDNLRTGKELRMKTNTPMQWVMCSNWKDKTMKQSSVDIKKLNLHTVKNSITNIEMDVQNFNPRRLKYRSLRLSSLHKNPCSLEPDLEPGKDMLFHIRMYKPYFFTGPMEEAKRRYYRYSLFLCNLMMLGSQKLSVLRDRFVCSNDLEMRVDVSNCPVNLPEPSAKEVFPSGFLFINNVFYVDTREGCVDYSKPIRDWALKKDIGAFQYKDMCTTRLDEIILRLGYPEVYVHQGNCEHVFTFSEIRLLGPSDPLHSSQYPCHSQSAINQLINCNVCAEFCAKWLISNCERVPFDPTVMCEVCFRQYLYKDGVKQCDFKAYRYRGNEMNVVKPQIG